MEIQSIAVGTPPPSAQIITGTGDGGTGFTKTMAETGSGQPDVVTAWIPTAYAVIARMGSAFFRAFSGAGIVGATGVIDVIGLKTAAAIGIGAAFVSFIMSMIAIWGSLEKKFPLVSQLT